MRALCFATRETDLSELDFRERDFMLMEPERWI